MNTVYAVKTLTDTRDKTYGPDIIGLYSTKEKALNFILGPRNDYILDPATNRYYKRLGSMATDWLWIEEQIVL